MGTERGLENQKPSSWALITLCATVSAAISAGGVSLTISLHNQLNTQVDLAVKDRYKAIDAVRDFQLRDWRLEAAEKDIDKLFELIDQHKEQHRNGVASDKSEASDLLYLVKSRTLENRGAR